METPTRKRPHRIKGAAPIQGFAVVVETEIGHVDFDADGDAHPFVVALNIVARHQIDSGFAPGTYRFPGEGENETVTIAIDSGR